MAEIDKDLGRCAFGGDPAGYYAARPAYPEWVYDVLRQTCGLGPGTATFEIGAGAGVATRRLVQLGAEPLVAIEPDARSAAFLETSIPDPRLSVLVAPFDTAALPEGGFDLGVSATAFHWLDEAAALRKIARLLRPGGWWAAVWNAFADDSRPDPFHQATDRALNGPRPTGTDPTAVEFSVDAPARIAALEQSGAFERIQHLRQPWTLTLDPDQLVALYATWSHMALRPDRDEVLAELRRIAVDQFDGRVIRNMITSLYIAQRR